MRQTRTTLLQGTLDLLILKALPTGEQHGLGVSRRVEQITGGTFVVQPGSLFPALHRLEEAGWLTSTWQLLREQPAREVVHAGALQANGGSVRRPAQWNRIALAMARALKAWSGSQEGLQGSRLRGAPLRRTARRVTTNHFHVSGARV